MAAAGVILRAPQIRIIKRFVHIESVLVVVCKAFAEKFFAALRYLRLCRKDDLPRIQYGLILQNGHLALIVSEGLDPEQQLVKYHANAPDVDFVRYLRALLVEAFGCLVPIGANALRR